MFKYGNMPDLVQHSILFQSFTKNYRTWVFKGNLPIGALVASFLYVVAPKGNDGSIRVDFLLDVLWIKVIPKILF